MVSYMNILLYGVGGLVVAGMALLVAFQEKLVYVPVLPGLTKSYAITPSRLRLTYEDIWFSASDGVRLHAWFIKLFPDTRGLFSFSILDIWVFISMNCLDRKGIGYYLLWIQRFKHYDGSIEVSSFKSVK